MAPTVLVHAILAKHPLYSRHGHSFRRFSRKYIWYMYPNKNLYTGYSLWAHFTKNTFLILWISRKYHRAKISQIILSTLSWNIKTNIILDLHSTEEILKPGLTAVPKLKNPDRRVARSWRPAFVAEWDLSENNINKTNKRKRSKDYFFSFWVWGLSNKVCHVFHTTLTQVEIILYVYNGLFSGWARH